MKIISKESVGKLIKDKDMVAISGSGGSGSCETILKGIYESFQSTGHPKEIGVTCGISPGNLTENLVGMNYLATPGLVGKAICAHLGMGKLFGQAIGNNEFPAFAVPLGVINHLYRAIAGKEVGILTHIGLHTFADPRMGGCRANEKAQKEKDLVSLMQIDGKDTLFYRTFPIQVAVVKASLADEEGNLSFEEEGVIGEQYHMAIAAKNSGGIVIAEVKKIVPKGSLKARNVRIHASLVDYVVLTIPDETLGEYNIPQYRKELTGDEKIALEEVQIRPLDERKVCGRRAALELTKNSVINLGVGMPDSVSNVCAEEKISDEITLSIETGITGGVPIGGVVFGAAINPESVIPTPDQFDAYNGGCLDMAIVGLAEVDEQGNVNVSKFGSRITGPGGFINITQSTQKIIFMGTFTNGAKEVIQNGQLEILEEGPKQKFVKTVEQVTFSATMARNLHQTVLYVTERGVFELVEDGIMLVEIAPGIDLQKDILNHMAFTPKISENLKLMDERIFKNEKMNLKLKDKEA